MPATLQIGDTSIPAEQLPELLSKYRLVPQIAKEMILDKAIAKYKVPDEEQMEAFKRFYQQNQLNTDQELEQWLQQQQLTRAGLAALIGRELRLKKFKVDKWSVPAESHFVKCKAQMDRVVFSMIRVKDIDVAEEIYFRILSEEATFMDLAPQYSDGLEAKTKGISGPVEFGKLDPVLANALVAAQPQEVLPPFKISDWWVVVQLETIIPVELDENTLAILIEDLFNTWINEQVQQYLQEARSAPELQVA
jgi:parvulin-like peptidyl-prolyl isomerase